MSLQRLVFEWAVRTKRAASRSVGSVVLVVAGKQVAVVPAGDGKFLLGGTGVVVRVEKHARTYHWCEAPIDVERVLEEIAFKLEAQQLAEVLT